MNSRPKDFADPPRWSVASLATGEHACLDHRSECAARNGRQLPPPGDVSHPDAHPGYSSKTRSSSRQANERSLSGSAKSMPTFRNSTNWDKTDVADGPAATSTPLGPLAGSGSPEVLGGTAGICVWHYARLRRHPSGLVPSMDRGGRWRVKLHA